MKIPGDPMTGSLPATHLVIMPRPSTVRLETWPLKPDIDPVNLKLLQPGNIAVIRTRLGIRERMIRTVGASRTRFGRGRRFFVGCNRRGWCWPYWTSTIISIQDRTHRP